MRFIKEVPAKGWRLPDDIPGRAWHRWWSSENTHENTKARFVFSATVRYEGYAKGRSSVQHIFKDVHDGFDYSMTSANFDELFKDILNNLVCPDCGTITDEFIFTKQGTQYGIKLYREDKN
jgi:rubredoxin